MLTKGTSHEDPHLADVLHPRRDHLLRDRGQLGDPMTLFDLALWLAVALTWGRLALLVLMAVWSAES